MSSYPYGKLLWQVTVPTGGWDFDWTGGAGETRGGRSVTIAAGTYATVLELCDALQTLIIDEGYAASTVAVSSIGYVTITIDDTDVEEAWSTCDEDLLAVLGIGGVEAYVSDAVTGECPHTHGWYPGVASFGATNGAAPSEDSDWLDSWSVAEATSGAGLHHRVGPTRASWKRTLGWDLLHRGEVLDPLRGVYAAGLAYCSPMRWYPDRTLGTVDLPGTAGDPQTDGETAPGWPELDGCEEYGTGDYWPVYLAREPNRRLHQSSGLYRSARLELLYTVEA